MVSSNKKLRKKLKRNPGGFEKTYDPSLKKVSNEMEFGQALDSIEALLGNKTMQFSSKALGGARDDDQSSTDDDDEYAIEITEGGYKVNDRRDRGGLKKPSKMTMKQKRRAKKKKIRENGYQDRYEQKINSRILKEIAKSVSKTKKRRFKKF